MIHILIQARRTLWSISASMLSMFAIPAGAQVQLFHPTNTVWRYQTNLAAQQEAVGDWVNPGFDDSSWPEGKGLFGNEVNYPYPMNTTAGQGFGPPLAVYFRSHFTWSGNTAGIVLFGTNYVDDGSIIYLNGVEIARFNMGPEANASTPDIQAPVANPGGYPNVNGGEPVLVRLEILLSSLTNGNPNPLVVGDNVIAVQVHQNGMASSDRVFGLTLYGGNIPQCFPDYSQLTNRVITEGRSTTFKIAVNCIPTPTIQWFRDVGAGEELISGATSPAYTITNVSVLDGGHYYAKVTTPAGTLSSPQATLVIEIIDDFPYLESARLGANSTEIIVMSSERLCTDFEACWSDATSWFYWEIFEADDPSTFLLIDSIVVDGLDIHFTLNESTPWAFDTRYTVRAADFGGVAGLTDGRGNPMIFGSSATTPPVPSAISVRANGGSDLYTFDSAPYPAEFSTFVWPGTANGASTVATLDSAVQALDASLITTGLPEATGNPPGSFGTARYASDTKNLITRPAGVLGNIIMAHLRNDTGSPAGGMTLTYTLTNRNPFSSEEIAGHLVYSSFNGAPNTWSPVHGLATNGVSGSKTGWVALASTPWPAGADMYILFVDDNAVGEEGIYEIDNFQARVGFFDPCSDFFDYSQPVLTRAFGPDSTTIVLTFSERMAASATNISSYSVSGATVIDASLNTVGTGITLTTTPRPVGNATVTITGLKDATMCFSILNFISPNPTTFNLTTVQKVVEWNASWEYNTNNLDAVPDWTTTGGTGWQTGNGLFGTEISPAATSAFPVPIATVIPPTAVNNQYLTSYYRKTVNLPVLSAGQSYAIGHYTDDGAVFYLDGAEIGRFNMPAGPVTYSTLTSIASMEGVLLSLPFTATAGEHVLAVEVHQSSLTSADVVFGASVIVVPTTAPALSIQPAGTNTVITWTADSSWRLNSSANPAGTYFEIPSRPFRRHSVPLPQPPLTPRSEYFRLQYVPQP